MSWSVNVIGRPLAVAAKVLAELDSYKCVEPEEQVKQHARDTILAAVGSFAGNMYVRVTASGHQSETTKPDGSVERCNFLSITVEPIYGFVE